MQWGQWCNMPKSIGTPELYLYFNIGLEPRDMIKMGYPRQSVYLYHKRFKIAKETLIARLIKEDNDKNGKS